MTTGPGFEFKRASDNGSHWKRARAWWKENGGFITGPWLLAVSLAVLALSMVSCADGRATKQATKMQCERTMQLGPYLAKDYAARNVFPPEVQRIVESTIPKTCPK